MKYRPMLSDISYIENEKSTSSMSSYRPTLKDLEDEKFNISNVETPFGKFPSTDLLNPAKNTEDFQKALEVYGSGLSPFAKAPQFIENAISKLPQIGQGVTNLLGRVGVGTGLNTASEAFNPDNQKNVSDIAKRNLILNSLLEGGIAPFRMASSISEFIHPLKYVSKKIEDIKNEYSSAVRDQKAAYKPVTDRYGDHLVTINPKNYLNFDKSELRRFTPDVKKSYEDFLGKPNFQNLHDLQSQMGKDWSRLANNPNKINTSQTLKSSRDKVKNKIHSFLSKDSESLANYLEGSEITKNRVSPFESTKELRKISKGIIKNTNPNKLYKSILSGMQKEYSAIPEGHYLTNVLKELKNKLDMGGAVRAIPGSSKFSDLTTNPFLQNTAKKINPFYYGLGRGLIGSQGNMLDE